PPHTRAVAPPSLHDARPISLNVAIHGSFGDYEQGWAKNAKGMYLILHGAEDQGFPLTKVNSVVQDLRGAKVPFQLEVYSGKGTLDRKSTRLNSSHGSISYAV